MSDASGGGSAGSVAHASWKIMHTVNARAVVLSFIRSYIAAHDDSPSLGEIANGVRSTKPAVARVIAGLERDGELIRLPAPARTKRRIVLPEQHVRALTLLRALGYEIITDLSVG